MTGLLAALLTAVAQIPHFPGTSIPQFDATFVKMPACGEQNSTCPYVYSEYLAAITADWDADPTIVGVAIHTAGYYNSSKEHWYVKYTDPWCVDCDLACFSHSCEKSCTPSKGWKHFVGKERFYMKYAEAVCGLDDIKFDLYVNRPMAANSTHSGCDPARPDVCMMQGMSFPSRYRCYDASIGECRSMGPEDCARQGMVYCEAPVTNPPTATPYPMAGRQPCIDRPSKGKCYEDDQCEWHSPGYCTVKKWDICSSPDKATCVQEQYTNERGATEACYWLWYAGKCGRQPCTSDFEDGCRADPYICEWDDMVGCKVQTCRPEYTQQQCEDRVECKYSTKLQQCVHKHCVYDSKSMCELHDFKCWWRAGVCKTKTCVDHETEGICYEDERCEWSIEHSPAYCTFKKCRFYESKAICVWEGCVWDETRQMCVADPTMSPVHSIPLPTGSPTVTPMHPTLSPPLPSGSSTTGSSDVTGAAEDSGSWKWVAPTPHTTSTLGSSDTSGSSATSVMVVHFGQDHGSWKWVALALVAVLLLLAGISLGWCMKGRKDKCCTMTTAVKDEAENTDCEYTIFEGVPIEKAN